MKPMTILGLTGCGNPPPGRPIRHTYGPVSIRTMAVPGLYPDRATTMSIETIIRYVDGTVCPGYTYNIEWVATLQAT